MPIKSQGLFGGSGLLEIKAGLVVYGTRDNTYMVTLHKPLPSEDKNQPPRLGPAMPASREALLDLLRGLENAPQARHLLPEHTLCWESGTLLWWRPAGRRRIFFKTKNDALNAISGREVMHPPLLFRAQKHSLHVWALPEDRRPTDERLKLCRAPYFNVYDSGSMCPGSVALPGDPLPPDIPRWEECFFGSNFAHGAVQDLCTHPKHHTGYWLDLAKGNATKAQAVRHLKPTGVTLEDVLKGNLK